MTQPVPDLVAVSRCINDVLAAGLSGDWTRIRQAVLPVVNRSPADAFAVSVGFIKVVTGHPRTVCAQHGPGAGCVVISPAQVWDAVGWPDEVGVHRGVPTPLPPKVEKLYPELVTYLCLVASEVRGERGLSAALWSASADAGEVQSLISLALATAVRLFSAGSSTGRGE